MSTRQKVRKFLRSKRLIYIITAVLSVAALVITALGVLQDKPTLMTVCTAPDGSVIYEDVGELTRGACPPGEARELLWDRSQLPLRVRGSTRNPNYGRDPHEVVGEWVRQFNRAFRRDLLRYEPSGPVEVDVWVGEPITVGAEWRHGEAYTSHWVNAQGRLSRARVGVEYVPDAECELRVGLHELGHVFMLSHSHGLMEPRTRCDGELRIINFPDHTLRALRALYPR